MTRMRVKQKTAACTLAQSKKAKERECVCGRESEPRESLEREPRERASREREPRERESIFFFFFWLFFLWLVVVVCWRHRHFK